MPGAYSKHFIALITDFGLRDDYVGTMKGVMLRINPELQIVDMSHEIAQGDIAHATFVLSRSYRYFPEKTIFILVVDPGVGSERRILAVETNNFYFIAPDNGVLECLFDNEGIAVRSVIEKKYFLEQISQTFHGRDIFAPVAAHLSLGTPFHALGPLIRDYKRGWWPKVRKKGNDFVGRILHIDRFGNCISNIPENVITKGYLFKIILNRLNLNKLQTSYAQVKSGEALAVIGSHGYLELAVRDGNAAEKYGIRVGDQVVVVFA